MKKFRNYKVRLNNSGKGFTPLEKSRLKAAEAGHHSGRRFQTGFTLIELIIAMAIFSFMLLILMVGVLQIFKMYQADLSSKRSQEAARTAMDEISRDVRDSNGVMSVHTNGTQGWICLDSDSLAIYETTDGTSLYKTSGLTNCSDGNFSGGTTTKIIDGSGVVQSRSFKPVAINDSSGDPVSVRINLVVTTGADDLFSDQNLTQCSIGAGAEFCASTTMSNVISLRSTF